MKVGFAPMNSDICDCPARSDNLLAKFESRRNADGLDCCVDAEAAGQPLDLINGIYATAIDDCSRADAESRRFSSRSIMMTWVGE